MKIVIALEESGLLIKKLPVKQLKMKQNNKKANFRMLLGKLGTNLLGDLLTGVKVIWAGKALNAALSFE